MNRSSGQDQSVKLKIQKNCEVKITFVIPWPN